MVGAVTYGASTGLVIFVLWIVCALADKAIEDVTKWWGDE